MYVLCIFCGDKSERSDFVEGIDILIKSCYAKISYHKSGDAHSEREAAYRKDHSEELLVESIEY